MVKYPPIPWKTCSVYCHPVDHWQWCTHDFCLPYFNFFVWSYNISSVIENNTHWAYIYYQHVLMLLSNSPLPVESRIKLLQSEKNIKCMWCYIKLTCVFSLSSADVHGCHLKDTCPLLLTRLLSSPWFQRPESTFLSMYLAISTSDLSAICNIKASVSMELNRNKREASIND